MNYIELTVYTTHEAEELISSKLWEYTSYGVAVCDENDVLELIEKRRNTWDYLEDGVTASVGTGITLVKAYFDMSDGDEKISAVTREFFAMRDNANGYLNFGTLETAKRRNAARERVVPNSVIERMYKTLEMPTTEEGFDEIIVINNEEDT